MRMGIGDIPPTNAKIMGTTPPTLGEDPPLNGG